MRNVQVSLHRIFQKMITRNNRFKTHKISSIKTQLRQLKSIFQRRKNLYHEMIMTARTTFTLLKSRTKQQNFFLNSNNFNTKKISSYRLTIFLIMLILNQLKQNHPFRTRWISTQSKSINLILWYKSEKMNTGKFLHSFQIIFVELCNH